MDRLQVPPIRTPVAEANGQPAGLDPARTAKEWYLYWQQSGERVNGHADSIAGLDTSVQEINGELDQLAKELDQAEKDLALLIRYGTHAARLAAAPDPIGGLWIETDRSNVVYQARDVAGTAAWVYVTGTMAGSLSQLPSDLGANDIYFSFATSDTYEVYRWSGSAWVNQTPANDLQIAYASAALTLTTSPTDVPGASLTLRRSGRYLVYGVFDFAVFAGDAGGPSMIGYLNANGTDQGSAAVFSTATAVASASVAQQWVYTAPFANQIVKLRAWKTAGTGNSVAQITHTSISALWVGP